MPYSDEQFGQRFPFSRTAQRIVKQKGFGLEGIPENVLMLASEFVLLSAQDKPFVSSEIMSHRELLEEEILAFPVAKILLSLIDRQWLSERFSRQLAKSAYRFIEGEKGKAELLLRLASELGIKAGFSGSREEFAEMELKDFLSVSFRDEKMKLVNRRLAKGKITLSVDETASFVSELVFQNAYSSLPLETKGLPQRLRERAKELAAEMDKFPSRKKGFAGMQLQGKLEPEAFPPCIADIYSRLLKHETLSFFQRFDIATFLIGIGLSEEQAIELFRSLPDYNAKLTAYHFRRIAGKGSSKKILCPGCSKVKEQGLCLRTYECNGIFSPISFYKRRLFGNKSE
ncbi:MAG: hypothetical protein WC602_03075 [archaeon]